MDSNMFSESEEFGSASQANESITQVAERWWMAEKNSPTLLQYQQHVVDTLQQQVQQAEDRVASLRSSSESQSRSLEVQLLIMDADRAKFLLRSYLRCRLAKIERFFLFVASSSDIDAKLSDVERNFAERYAEAVDAHFSSSILRRMPTEYNSMVQQSSTNPGTNMVPEPALDDFVFCRATEALEGVALDDEGDSIDLQPGQLHVLRFRPIMQLVEAGKIELL